MKYEGTVIVTVTNGKEKSTHTFEDEVLDISRATRLGISNLSDKESNLFETMKLWNQIDSDTNTTSYYEIKTENNSTVESFRKYYITSVNNEEQRILFHWI